MSTKSRTKSSPKKSLANEVLAVVLVAAAILLVLSLFTYDPQDTSFNSVGPQREPRNLIGVVGAFISDAFLQWFGLASLMIPALLVLVAIRAFSTSNPGFPARKALGATLLLVAFSGFLALFPEIKIGLLSHSHNGGAIGQMIEGGLAGMVSTTGAAVVLAAASVLTLMLTMEISLARIGRWVHRIREARAEVRQTKPTIFNRMAAWWEARSEQRMAVAAQRKAEKAEEQKRKDEERAERDRVRQIELDRERKERNQRIEEARRLKEQKQPVASGPIVETFSAPPPPPEIIVAGAGVSGAAAARLSMEQMEPAPAAPATRMQMRELVQERAVRVEQLKAGRAPRANEITMDPTVAEMISTASIVRTVTPEKNEPETQIAKPARKKTVETLTGNAYKMPT